MTELERSNLLPSCLWFLLSTFLILFASAHASREGSTFPICRSRISEEAGSETYMTLASFSLPEKLSRTC